MQKHEIYAHKEHPASMELNYDESGNQIEQAYFGVDGKPCSNSAGYTRITWEYDERGNVTVVCGYGLTGNLVSRIPPLASQEDKQAQLPEAEPMQGILENVTSWEEVPHDEKPQDETPRDEKPEGLDPWGEE